MGKLNRTDPSPDARYGSGDSARCHRISLCDLSHRTGRSWNPADYGNMAGSFSETLFVCLAVIAVLRGILHYGEQACNHYIAFKLLALIRHKVFAALRKLCLQNWTEETKEI